jgi:hypothetical protein
MLPVARVYAGFLLVGVVSVGLMAGTDSPLMRRSALHTSHSRFLMVKLGTMLPESLSLRLPLRSFSVVRST